MEPTIQSWLDVELNHAKYTKDLWGRSVIRAIDLDDSIALYDCMNKPGVNIDTQIDFLGYAQYLWTCMVHKYFGDTALHLAVRQRKMMCVHMLLRLHARADIPNSNGETADNLCIKLFGTTAKNMEYEAIKFLLHRTPLKDIPRLPDDPRYRHIEKEAWGLMEQGRVLYSELPKSFGGADPILDKHLALIRKNFLSFNLPKKQGESKDAALDGDTPAATESAADAVASENPWVLTADANGNQYYFNEGTGESSWEKPAGFVSASPSRAATASTASGKPNSSASSSSKASPPKTATVSCFPLSLDPCTLPVDV